MEKMKIVAGLDIGNGYVKGKVKVNNSEIRKIDLPSSVSYTVGSNIPKNPTDEYMMNLHNELDVTMISKGIKTKDDGRVFFGTRGILSGESQTEFNIENHIPKCNDSLSTMLILGSIASAAVREYWLNHKDLPTETLPVVVYTGIALPIEDYMEYKDQYTNTLKEGSHHVHIHNFEKPINVEIQFVEVAVLPEGAAGQYAITNLGSEFLQEALNFARHEGAEIDEAYTGEVLTKVMNTIGIDIGEGTTNFPVFVNGDISIEASRSINKGIGSVYTAVVAELRNENYAFDSRKSLADFMMQNHEMPTQKRIAQTVQRCVDKHVKVFVRDVMSEFSNIFRKVGIRTDAIYVYGGGANIVQEILYPALIEAATLDEGQCLPVIYLDSGYSRDLNRNGLFEAATLISE